MSPAVRHRLRGELIWRRESDDENLDGLLNRKVAGFSPLRTRPTIDTDRRECMLVGPFSGLGRSVCVIRCADRGHSISAGLAAPQKLENLFGYRPLEVVKTREALVKIVRYAELGAHLKNRLRRRPCVSGRFGKH